MTEKNIYVIPYLFLLVLFSCSFNGKESNKESEKSILNIDLNTGHQKIKFSKYFSIIEIVPLETARECIIGKARKIIGYNSKYYVEDSKQNLVRVFDENGFFINTIGKIGKGPGEHLILNDFNINKYENTIELLSVNSSKITSYSESGEYLKTYKLPSEMLAPNSFCIVSSDSIVFNSNYDDYKLYYYSRSKNKILECVKQDPNFNSRKITISRFHSSFSQWNNNVLWSEMFSNDIYKYNGKEFKIVYSWDFGAYNFDLYTALPLDKSKTFYSKYINQIKGKYAMMFRYVIENNDIIMTNFVFNNSFKTLIYNKINHDYTVFEAFEEGGYIPDKPCFFENGIYFIVDATNLHDVIPQNALDSTNLTFIKNIRVGDNPVIIKYYFK